MQSPNLAAYASPHINSRPNLHDTSADAQRFDVTERSFETLQTPELSQGARYMPSIVEDHLEFAPRELGTAAHPLSTGIISGDWMPNTSRAVKTLANSMRSQLCGKPANSQTGVFKCPSRRHAYGASWLARTELLQKVNIHYNTRLVQLEMASHDMFATAGQALKTACYDGFFVEHLSAYPKHVKMAEDHQNPAMIAAIRRRATDAVKESCNIHAEVTAPPRTDVDVLIPFFTGEVPNPTGRGKHSFGDHELRLDYLMATLCSVEKYFAGQFVLGVCDHTDDAALMREYFQDSPHRTPRHRVVQLPCGEMSNNLPNKVLAAGQALASNGTLRGKFVFFTESDHVVWWRSHTFLRGVLEGLDASTYYTPYRVEETYVGSKQGKVAARVKDTTGPTVAVAGGREYTITNQCQHERFPHPKPSRRSGKGG